MQLKATPVDGGWVLNGQKSGPPRPTSLSGTGWAARTDPDAPKHDGITLFLVPMDHPGLTINGICAGTPSARGRATGRPTARLAPMAKLFACRTFRNITATAQQIFGGNGFTVEYDIQLYFRRAKQLQLTWWDDRYLTDLIAADVLDG